MRYMTKVEWILDDDNFMLSSKEVSNKERIAFEKSGKSLTTKMKWNLVNKQIKRKLQNPKAVKGICTCDDHFLCEHRKKYLKEALDGKGKTSKA